MVDIVDIAYIAYYNYCLFVNVVIFFEDCDLTASLFSCRTVAGNIQG